METQDTSGFSSGEVYFSPTWSSGVGSPTLVGASTLGHPLSSRLLLSHVLRSPHGLRYSLTPQPPSTFQPAGRNLDYRKGDRWSQLSFNTVSQRLPQSISTSSRWPDFTTSLGKLIFILGKHELHENAYGCVRLSGSCQAKVRRQSLPCQVVMCPLPALRHLPKTSSRLGLCLDVNCLMDLLASMLRAWAHPSYDITSCAVLDTFLNFSVPQYLQPLGW